MDRAALIERITMTWAENSAAHARVLRIQDPRWGSEVFELDGGLVVLCGPGLYVNRALGLGLARPVTDADFELLEARSLAVGVAPAVDVVPTADRSLTERAGARGYARHRFLTTHLRPLTEAEDSTPVDPTVVIARADDGVQLAVWQDVAADGFAVGDGDGRRASDAFAAAAAVVDGPGFVLARDADDGRPLGCASVTIRDGLATLGAMSTRPTERRRGVQSALIAHRLRMAAAAGCDFAVSSTVPASASERNLWRAGFRPLYETVTLAREPRATGSS